MLFKRNKQTNRGVAVGLDFGSGQLKAVVLRAEGPQTQLVEYAATTTSLAVGQSGAEPQLAAELQQLLGTLTSPQRNASVAISSASALLTEIEMPRMPIAEARTALKFNSARYLHRDVSAYYLDVSELPDQNGDGKAKKSQMMRVLVGGAPKTEVQWYRTALAAAKVRPTFIELTAVSIVNAFRIAQPELCQKENVLLLDIGATYTTMNFLRLGHPRLTRIMQFGGAQISQQLASLLALDAKTAEDQKRQPNEAALPVLRTALIPLARELRASIDFFERQQECHISRVLASGGSACGSALLTALSEHVGVKIEPWNPVETFDNSRLTSSGPRLAALAPSLAAAVGTAAARLQP